MRKSTISIADGYRKYGALVALAVQNTVSVVVMRWSRTSSEQHAIASTAVLLAEILKLFISFTVHVSQQRSPSVESVANDIFGKDSLWIKMTVPAALYTLQNWLHYFALSLIDATTHQVTMQLRILATAMCAVIMLNKKLAWEQWIALVTLTLGMALTQLPMGVTSHKYALGSKASMDQFVGLSAVALTCLTSGLSGVYLEKVLKQSATTLWVRNIQLAIFSSIFCAIFGVMLHDGAAVYERGFFAGYGWATTCAVLLNAVGGLLVANVIKYADNIVKNSAIAISIVASGMISAFLGDFTFTPNFLIGAVIVVSSVWAYSLHGAPTPLHKGDIEKGSREPVILKSSKDFA
ncbi:UDP-galactose transporter [Spizellomyces punctatus DAOM BR117]|uniref:UDP-galactose transporter n=1 Tax=Spizellomyces punctatus (strain DAOM BR117) TaxID=645134 RepID=A0A0L0H787_SPIPD|nr:UDP-galactose transporter [Spizellomyces punctatus DAOM BR117]KNC96563.1 UDP-galactose transporter [Spizellomyces punctatus DAOM BR117]|eukprot:XP_016604603.1 UDP-galactose transporter [Spizellomyces punctatus DAOM BR117]